MRLVRSPRVPVLNYRPDALGGKALPQEEIITLRLLHIVFGAFWVGTAVFVAASLEPALRAAAPGARGPILSRLSRGIGHMLVASAVITLAAGVVLALRLRQDSLDAWFDTGWGVAMLIGFIVSVIALGTSLITGSTAGAIARIDEQSEDAADGSPGETGSRAEELGARFRAAVRWTAVLTVVGVGTMAAARFV